MAISTRLTDRLGIAHPILSAPMGTAAGGRLAAAVSQAGGLGLIGGGYGDADWLFRELREAGNARVGCGFITWSLARAPELLDPVLEHAPAAVMLSFGDPSPFAARIRATGAALICQVQSISHARQALAAGADILVAQGTEAGGHAGSRATLPLVPEVADLCRAEAPETIVVAAGGIADGRGLAAALMLGADGVLMGSRFWASREATVPDGYQRAALVADGDTTIKTRSVDTVRGYEWPDDFSIRVLRNRFTDRWHGREADLRGNAGEQAAFAEAASAGDAERGGVIVGEAVSMIHYVQPAGSIVSRVVAEAEALLAAAPGRLARPGRRTE